MPKIEVYTTNYCPYCTKAKKLLELKGAKYKEIDISDDDEARTALVQKAGGARTVPQIFIDGKHIGGCDDLYALNDKGGLDPLLNA
jgi:glutaredoxin 3